MACEYAEVYRDEDGRVVEAFCRCGRSSCKEGCEDYTPEVQENPVVTDLFAATANLEPPF